MVLWIDFDRAHKMLASLFETSVLVQEIPIIHEGRDIIWRDAEERAKRIASRARHPQFLECQRQIDLDAHDIGTFKLVLMRLYVDFQKTAAMTDALLVLIKVGMRCSKRKTQV